MLEKKIVLESLLNLLSNVKALFSLSVDDKRKMALFRGVEAIRFDPTVLERKDVNRLAIDKVKTVIPLVDGDLVLLTKGDHMGKLGGTNALKILKVGEIV